MNHSDVLCPDPLTSGQPPRLKLKRPWGGSALACVEQRPPQGPSRTNGGCLTGGGYFQEGGRPRRHFSFIVPENGSLSCDADHENSLLVIQQQQEPVWPQLFGV
jgi:hypothetical protein